MRIPLLALFLFGFQSPAQTVFTDVFAPDFPTAIQIVGDDLYVGTYSGGYLAKVPLNNPADVTIVSNNFITGGGPWKMDYDPNSNTFYIGVFPGIPGCYTIDLNNPLPVDSESYADFNFFDGLIIEDTKMYFAGRDQNGNEGQLYVIDLTVGPSSYELVYSDPEESLRNPVIYNDFLYYGNRDVNNPDFTSIYRLDLNSSNPTREYVSTVGGGGLQSSYIDGSYLYLGLEFSPSQIVRINLESSEIPIPQEEIVNDLSGGIIGLALHEDNLYITEGGTGRILVYSDPILNITDANNLNFMISKIPVTEHLELSGPDNQFPDYNIYNISGQLVTNGKYSGNAISMLSVRPGLYFITLELDGASQTMKFIKK